MNACTSRYRRLARTSRSRALMNESERIVVVGTGPAGAAAAVFLARAGVKPLLLEAGSNHSRLGLTARIRGVTVAKLKPSVGCRQDLVLSGDATAHIFEALAPGGLSNHWSCAVPRFAADDFEDAICAGPEFEWPIDYDDLSHWYERVEPLLHIAGASRDRERLPAARCTQNWELGQEWTAVAEEASKVGRDVVAMPYAYGGETTFTRAATPFNAFTRLIAPAERAGKVEVRYGARVSRLEWSAVKRRVTEVVCRDPVTGSEERIPCRAVILAAGAVNTAEILLNSRSSNFPDGLGNSHGVLGKYLHDHPMAKLVLDVDPAVALNPASYITRPPIGYGTPLYAAAFMQWAGVGALARSCLTSTPGRARRIGFTVFGTMVPSRDDFVAVTGSNGGPGSLSLSLGHSVSALDTLSNARDELVSIMTRAGWNPRIRVYHVEAPGNSVHYGGTCRMHRDPKFGVVDSYCRVFDSPNVVVADSAVFTTGPEKNPVLTAMTLAARAADRLALELRPN